MKYIELKVEIEKEYLDKLLDRLESAGYDSVLIDDPEVVEDIVSHPEVFKYDYLNEEMLQNSGRRPTVTLYFSDDDDGRTDCDKASKIARGLVPDGTATANEAVLADQEIAQGNHENEVSVSFNITGDDSEWLYKWQENFKPTSVSEHIVVKPSWEDYDPKPGEFVIEMDPGMAFGSGLHETTSMCVKALEKYLKPGDKVLDVGTGTGILSIASAGLGASDCLGIDIDDEAVRVGTDNVAGNGMADKIEIRKGDLTQGVKYEPDVVVANLMADLVMRLSPSAAEHLKTGGVFISSGILDIKEEVVSKAVVEAGFNIEEILRDGEWRAIVATKK